MSNIILIILYCLLVAAASFSGGMLPSLIQLTHNRVQLMMSFVGGLMMGVAILNMLPHGIVEAGSVDYVLRSVVLGMLVMFFLIRVFHVHQHGHGDNTHGHEDTCHHRHDFDHDHQHEEDQRERYSHPLSWVGLFVGLAIHTLIDGIALGGSVMAGTHDTAGAPLAGLAVFSAILMHKPLDALSITTVMAGGGWDRRSQLVANALFALMCPLGAITFLLCVQQLGAVQYTVLGCALGFSAGVFLCISLGDILPELQFHQHDRTKLSIALLLGVLLAFAMGIIEPHHVHHAAANGL